MTQYYIQTTGTVVSESELRALHPNTSFPTQLDKDTLAEIGAELVFPTPSPVVTDLQFTELAGTEIDSKGNRVQKWVVKNKFTGTGKTAKERAYLAELLAQRKVSMSAALKAARVEKEKSGVEFQFPDGLGIIQTRDDVDIRNVQAVTTTALILKSSGVTDPIIPFRDQADMIHMITPDKAIELGLTVQNFISSTYSQMWQAKSLVEAATTSAELDAINTSL